MTYERLVDDAFTSSEGGTHSKDGVEWIRGGGEDKQLKLKDKDEVRTPLTQHLGVFSNEFKVEVHH